MGAEKYNKQVREKRRFSRVSDCPFVIQTLTVFVSQRLLHQPLNACNGDLASAVVRAPTTSSYDCNFLHIDRDTTTEHNPPHVLGVLPFLCCRNLVSGPA